MGPPLPSIRFSTRASANAHPQGFEIQCFFPSVIFDRRNAFQFPRDCATYSSPLAPSVALGFSGFSSTSEKSASGQVRYREQPTGNRQIPNEPKLLPPEFWVFKTFEQNSVVILYRP